MLNEVKHLNAIHDDFHGANVASLNITMKYKETSLTEY
jgi:hypothetical protein